MGKSKSKPCCGTDDGRTRGLKKPPWQARQQKVNVQPAQGSDDSGKHGLKQAGTASGTIKRSRLAARSYARSVGRKRVSAVPPLTSTSAIRSPAWPSHSAGQRGAGGEARIC